MAKAMAAISPPSFSTSSAVAAAVPAAAAQSGRRRRAAFVDRVVTHPLVAARAAVRVRRRVGVAAALPAVDDVLGVDDVVVLLAADRVVGLADAGLGVLDRVEDDPGVAGPRLAGVGQSQAPGGAAGQPGAGPPPRAGPPACPDGR